MRNPWFPGESLKLSKGQDDHILLTDDADNADSESVN